MNYLYTLLTAFFFLQTLNAQRFFVEEFRYDPSDISAIRYERSDVNDLKCAIIKVRSNIEGLHFDSNLGITHLEARTGEVWLYVSPGERGLKFMRQGYITMDYNIPIRIESSRVYILELLATTVDDNGISEIESQWLIITSQPEGADIYINNEPAGRTPYQNELPAGEYSWRVTSSLYLPEEGIVTLQPGDGNREQFHIELTPNYGTLVIRSSPENGASVSLNGINMNLTTPATLERVPAGNNTITLSLNDYETTSESIQLSAGEHRNLDISMRPTFATVMVETEPPSVIFINDQNRGSSIWEGRLTPGVYTFEARLDRHRPATERQQIISGEQYMVRLNPEPITGSLRIISMPIGAQIRIEGRDYGTTPVTIRDLIIGEYNVEISHTGHASIIEQVNITEGGTSEINTTLPEGMEVIITSTPPGADLYINDIPYGKTPFVGDLAYGSYLVNAIHDDIATTEVIEVRHGEKSSFEIMIKLEVIDADGNVYETVKIGNQFWMAENLKTTRYNDRRRIAYLASNTSWLRTRTGAYNWYRDDISYKDKHGALYNWHAVNTGKLCPVGWRVPTDEDWKILEGTVDTHYSVGDPIWNGSDVNSARGYDAGQKLRYASLGFSPNSTAFVNHQRTFLFPVFGSSQWWSATEYSSTHSWYRELRHQSNNIDRLYTNKNYGFPVRCVSY